MAKHDGVAQRDAAPEVGLAGGGLSEGLSGRIDAARGSGSPLDDGTRSTMEGALGTPLDSVRVHVGGESDALNQAIHREGVHHRERRVRALRSVGARKLVDPTADGARAHSRRAAT